MPSRSRSLADSLPTPGSASTFRSRLVALFRSDDEGVVRLAAIHDLHLGAGERRAKARCGGLAPLVVDVGADVQREQAGPAQGAGGGRERGELVVVVRDHPPIGEREVPTFPPAL